MVDKTLGQVAFEAHRDFLDGVRPWSDVREPEREVWEATAAAVAEAVRSAGPVPGKPTAFRHFPPASGMDDQAAEDNGIIG